MATIDVKDAAGSTVAVEKPNANGRAAAAASRPVALSTEDKAALDTLGGLTEAAPASDTASSGLNGRLQRVAQRLTSLMALLPASLGTKAASASLAVALSTEDKAQLPATLGSKAAASSLATTMSTEDLARFGSLTETAPASDTASSGLNGRLQRVAQNLTALNAALVGTEYETVAASQTDQALGATGATGDLLTGVLIIPATTSPGLVQIQDGAGTAITVFAGGADSVSTLHPFFVPLGIRSGAGAWSITTGANVSAIGVGNFS